MEPEKTSALILTGFPSLEDQGVRPTQTSAPHTVKIDDRGAAESHIRMRGLKTIPPSDRM